MTITEIRAILEREIDDTVTAPNISAWVYSAMVEIAKQYGRIAEAQQVAVADTFYDLPNDYLATSTIRDSEGEHYFDYEITELGQIAFERDDTYDIEYFAMPEALPTVEATMLATVPEVHLLFHPAIVDWCKHKYWDNEASVLGVDQGESMYADKFKMSFYQQVAQSVLVLKNRARKKRKIRRIMS